MHSKIPSIQEQSTHSTEINLVSYFLESSINRCNVVLFAVSAFLNQHIFPITWKWILQRLDKFIRIPISGTLKISFIGTGAIIASLDIDHYASHIINHHQIQQNFRDEPNKYQFNNENTFTQTLNMLMNALIESQNPSDFTAEFLLIFRHAMKFVYLI